MSNIVPSHRSFEFPTLDNGFFGRLFDMGDFFGASFRVDIKDNQDHYLVEAELPGVKKEQICLEVEGDRLTISASLNEEKKEERARYLYSERRTGRFQRSFSLKGVEKEGITASYKDGVLKIVMPKQEAQEDRPSSHTIPIQ